KFKPCSKISKFISKNPENSKEFETAKKKSKKLLVESYRPGCGCGPTPGRDPTTARHGDFWLLGFPSGPVRLSLANLATPDSSRVPILMASLVRTPSQRGSRTHSDPRPQILHNN
ncbi:hypothetical protein KQX54_002307, partial [Cotesia glomerata]